MSEFKLTVAEGGTRLDAFVAAECNISRTRAAELIEQAYVLADGAVRAKNYKLKAGQGVYVSIPEPVEYEAKPQDIPLDIVYEDDDLLVVNKPKGMVVHPAAGNLEGTLVNALLFHCRDSLSGIGGVMRPGIVHRIDKNTSGLLVVAKNDAAHICLSEQIKAHSFTRQYEAVVYGNVKQDTLRICAPIGRHPTRRKEMAVTDKNSKEAATNIEVIERLSDFTHIKCILETGRTHQIRVHMAFIGHPVAGDEVYGRRKVIKKLNGQCLHARKLGFFHPNGQYMEFESELPEYFTDFLKELKQNG